MDPHRKHLQEAREDLESLHSYLLALTRESPVRAQVHDAARHVEKAIRSLSQALECLEPLQPA